MAGHKQPRVIHEKRAYTPGSPESHVYLPAKTASESRSLFLIASGYGGTPEDYLPLARCIAAIGGTALVPDCNEPAPGNASDDPMEYRSDVLCYAAEDALEHYELDSIILVGHSFGAAYQAPVIEKAPGDIKGYVSVMGAGFEKITPHNRHFGVKRQLADGVSALPRLALGALKHPESFRKRLDLSRRYRELLALYNMSEGHNLRYIQLAQDAGAVCVAIVGPQDWIISADETRRIASSTLGEQNIHDAHANAGHFAPQTHAKHMARLITQLIHRSEPLSEAA